MRTRAAVMREPEADWEVVELDLADPGPGEVLVEMAFAGMCHSDEHLRHGPGVRPIVGGHEGSGVVQALGPPARGRPALLQRPDGHGLRAADPGLAVRLITRRYSLDELNQGYRDQAAGEIVRGLLVHAD